MNKSISVSIGGFSFFIEEDAYQKLKKYLDEVRTSLYSEGDDADEIIKDVESRIAELFREWLGNYRQVLDTQDVDKMINVMGTPEQYHSESLEDEKQENTESYKNTSLDNQKFYQKKLFRDPDNKMLGGVLSGLSKFFNIETTWLRLGLLLFILLSSWILKGSFIPGIILIYIILWIAIPEAKTTSDKLKMKGKPVTFDSIKEFVNSDEISEKANQAKKNLSKAGSDFGNFLENFFKAIGRIIIILIGLIFLVTGIGSIVTFFIATLSFSFGNVNTYDGFQLFMDEKWQIYLAVFLTGIIVLLPSIAFINLGVKLISNKILMKINPWISSSAIIIWILSSIAMTVLIFSTIVNNFDNEVEKRNQYVLNTQSDTLSVSLMDEYSNSGIIIKSKSRYNFGFKIDTDDKITQDSIYKNIDKDLEIKKSPDKNYYLQLKYSASGKDVESAKKNMSDIQYNYKLNGNELSLNSYLALSLKSKFRKQNVKLCILVPEGKYLKVNNFFKVFSQTEDNYQDYYDISNNIFKFDKNNLKCVNCKDSDYNEDINSEESDNDREIQSVDSTVNVKKTIINKKGNK